ncbi:MAG: alkaline phosphatase [Planctomycetota bacterium]
MKMVRAIVLVFLGFAIAGAACSGGDRSNNSRQNVLNHRRAHLPKNVIILIGDGCGFNHIKSADYYLCGETPCQKYENFPVRLAMSTYPAGGEYDPKVAWCSFDYVYSGYTDSAAAATTMAAGVKTYNAAIGVDINGVSVMNLAERAEQMGKSTGVITSVPFSHATPAGFVVHNGNRNNYTQITSAMINDSAADVIMGCGHPLYNANGGAANPNYRYISSIVWNDLKNGSAGADADADGIADPWKLVQTRAEFQALAKGDTPKRVFGLPQVYETLQEKRSGNRFAAPYQVPLIQSVPTLEELTLAALNILDENHNGFFIMIEGGAIDWAAHGNESGRLIEEMDDFNNSIEAVIDWVRKNSNWGETLVIITADHETGYLTGPGSGQLPQGPVWNDLVANGIGVLPTMEWHSSSHTNSLVPFFAKGRGARLFKNKIAGYDPVRGPYIDNTDIANVIFSLWPAD